MVHTVYKALLGTLLGSAILRISAALCSKQCKQKMVHMTDVFGHNRRLGYSLDLIEV